MPRTTTSATWNWSRPKPMQRTTPRNGWLKILNLESSFVPQGLKPQKHGINPKRERHGTRNTPSVLLRQKRSSAQSKYALGAVRPISASLLCGRKVFAVCPVKGWHEKPVEWMTCNEPAKNAERSSWQINTPRQGSATQNVPVFIQRGNASREKVYNLTVETDNEYYANGVLVHNCDSLQYIAMGLLLVMSTGDDDVAQYETEIEWC